MRLTMKPVKKLPRRQQSISRNCAHHLLNKSVSLLFKKERGNDNHVKRSSPVDQKRGREA